MFCQSFPVSSFFIIIAQSAIIFQLRFSCNCRLSHRAGSLANRFRHGSFSIALSPVF
ncbi:hypothetical protein CLOSYM_01667 [[Clostridium] symbiosum ATCC 14940]|uniref:Uncharacterized protein n=1 Tax=[Clostridium] symbiosum ATCC 14940 TaxID=411472 RepID=A0ABC9TZS5_CLOSY|nr:hypothetical protein CLOSYM_01667 [[Clostridium] symbiosum ATCC 14940]